MDQIAVIVTLIWSVINGAGKLGVTEMLAYHQPSDLTKDPGWGRVRILTTGDVMLGRMVNVTMENKQDFSWPFKQIQPYFAKSDATLINLEAPLVTGCKLTGKGMVFCGNPKGIEGLKLINVTVANLANNHMLNYGESGRQMTKDALNKFGILITGDGAVTVKVIKGTRYGFLGFNDVPMGVKIDELRSEITELRKQADVIIVSFHWGMEYVADPVARQIELGRTAIDSGADLVIGNHPHWVEAIEIYKEKLIVYSHGNFVFDQPWSQETQEGVVGNFEFMGNKLVEAGFYPVIINEEYQPRMASEAESDRILKRMRDASVKLVK